MPAFGGLGSRTVRAGWRKHQTPGAPRLGWCRVRDELAAVHQVPTAACAKTTALRVQTRLGLREARQLFKVTQLGVRGGQCHALSLSFIDEETEAQKAGILLPSSHRWQHGTLPCAARSRPSVGRGWAEWGGGRVYPGPAVGCTQGQDGRPRWLGCRGAAYLDGDMGYGQAHPARTYSACCMLDGRWLERGQVGLDGSSGLSGSGGLPRTEEGRRLGEGVWAWPAPLCTGGARFVSVCPSLVVMAEAKHPLILNPSCRAPLVPGTLCHPGGAGWAPGTGCGPPFPAGRQVWSPGLTRAASAALRPAW
nr:uncharacterized protein LOC129046064 [Mirounga angustirostris]